MNIMKSNNRDYANADFVATVLDPIRNLEIYFKSPAEIIVSNNEISDEGYRLLLSLVGGRMMPNGINALVMSRSDMSIEDKLLIKEKFSKFNSPVWFEQTRPVKRFSAYDGSHALSCGSIDPDSGSSGKHACSS